MSRKFIISIAILTGVALTGLVGIQFYWMNSAMKIKEANFRTAVDEAISNVIFKIDQIELKQHLNNRMSIQQQGSAYLSVIDSLVYLYASELDSIPWASDFSDSLKFFDGRNIRVEIFMDDKGRVVKRFDTTQNYQLSNDFRNNFEASLNIASNVPEKDVKNLKEKYGLLLQNAYRMNDMLGDIMNTNERLEIEHYIPHHIMDSLIRSELKIKGIGAEYEYCIYKQAPNQLVYQRTGDYSEKMLQESVGYPLYPRDVFRSPEFLMIYFPHEKEFLITQMWGLLLGSIIFIGIIVLSFYYSIKTIFRQRKISEMKNDFINNMTHEFKTPIATVSLACQALNDKDIQKSTELYESYVGIIDQENKRLGIMAEKILQTALLEKGELNLRYETVNIEDLITEAVQKIRMQVEIKDGSISTSLNAAKNVLSGDRMHLINVITNLLDNANKYSPRKPAIEIETENTNGGVNIFIKDQGLGISKADQKKIFDKLYRVHTGDRHDVKGFGLGLSYVKFIVDKHGGNISLDSELNKGTKFKIFLPFEAFDPTKSKHRA
jgi:two-component system phosphate regulon sensor histidine kinase PhoR